MPTRSPATISEIVKLEHGVALEDVKTEGTDETEDMTEVKAPDLPPPMPLGPDDGHPPAEAAAAFPPPIAQDQQHLPLPNGFGYTAPNHPHDGGIAVLLEGAAGTEAMGENAAADGMAAMPGLPPVGAVAAMPHIPLPHMYPRNIGMPEVIIPAKWLSRYEELKRYKQHHGDTNVPQKYETNPQLGAWCRTQKQQMKLLQEGKPTHMSQARLELLNEIGFEFTGEKRDKVRQKRKMPC